MLLCKVLFATYLAVASARPLPQSSDSTLESTESSLDFKSFSMLSSKVDEAFSTISTLSQDKAQALISELADGVDSVVLAGSDVENRRSVSQKLTQVSNMVRIYVDASKLEAANTRLISSLRDGYEELE